MSKTGFFDWKDDREISIAILNMLFASLFASATQLSINMVATLSDTVYVKSLVYRFNSSIFTSY